MDTIHLDQILAIARTVSTEADHFFVGVEHLFTALTRLSGGVTASLLENRGLLGFYADKFNRDSYGKVEDQRFWPDHRITDRAQRVLDHCQKLMSGGVLPVDRALLMAILAEGDNVAVRILEELGADIPALYDEATHWTSTVTVYAPLVPIEIDDPSFQLDKAQEHLLRLMFRGADRIYIRRSLQDGFSGAMVLLVQIYQNVLHAPVVVKLDEKQAIQYEKLRYDQWVKGILPPNTSSIVDDPVYPPDAAIGGIKYTFVSRPGANAPANLRQFAQVNGVEACATFIKNSLYETFGHYWWNQGRSIRFEIWREYDFLLPPALIVDILPPDNNGDTANMTFRILRPADNKIWSRTNTIRVGDTVVLEDFVVQKFRADKRSLTVSMSAVAEAEGRANRVEVRNIDVSGAPYQRGQSVKRLVGRVMKTREDLLQEQVQLVEPDFNFMSPHLTAPYGAVYINPLLLVNTLLETWIEGRLTPIHGDLHMGNILIGPAEDAWLIDFEHTRRGHVLFDWAQLETSLIMDLVIPTLSGSWADAWEVIRILEGSYRGNWPADKESPYAPIRAVREIVNQLLTKPGGWDEYHQVIALCALRALSWSNRPLLARRVMYLLAAMSLDAARVDPQNLPINSSSTDKTTVDTPRTQMG
jgi:hypothetical protein